MVDRPLALYHRSFFFAHRQKPLWNHLLSRWFSQYKKALRHNCCRSALRFYYLFGTALHGNAAIIGFYVILSACAKESASPFKRKRITARLTAVSPAGSVGASASQRCPPDTRTAMTGRMDFRAQFTTGKSKYSKPLLSFSALFCPLPCGNVYCGIYRG